MLLFCFLQLPGLSIFLFQFDLLMVLQVNKTNGVEDREVILNWEMES